MNPVHTAQTAEYVFTFGQGMRLRSTLRDGSGAGGFGFPLADRFVAITAADREEARAIMWALFGGCWSFDYGPRPAEATGRLMSAREAAGVDEFGLRELDITEALEAVDGERRAMSPVDGPTISWADYLKRLRIDVPTRPEVSRDASR